jgi:hypothetical protein
MSITATIFKALASRTITDELDASPTALPRLPKFMMQRKNFHQRGGGEYGWKNRAPYQGRV